MMLGGDGVVVDLEARRRAILEEKEQLAKIEVADELAAPIRHVAEPTASADIGTMTPGEIDAKIAQAKAEGETSLAKAMGEFRASHEALLGAMQTGFAQIEGRLYHVEKSTAGLRSTVVITAIASVLSIGALVFAALSYGDAVFGRGMDVSNAIDARIERATPATQSVPAETATPATRTPTKRDN